MMKKIVDLLEQHVQWIAIGIGVLYLAFTIWSYVINNPVTTQVRGSTVDLGTVDQTILDSAGRPLQQAIESTDTVPGLSKPPEISGQFAQQIQDGRAQYQNVSMKAGFDAATQTGGDYNYQPIEQVRGPVKHLPVPPTPVLVGVLPGRAQVAVQPGMAPQPNPANNGNPQNANGPAVVDKNWVTVEGKITIAPLGAAMIKEHIPGTMQLTEFLRLDLDRQELLANGTWGNDTIVQPPLYLGIPPMPADNNSSAAIQYANWAKSNVMLILQPPFYNVVKGTPWYLPSDTATAQALTNPGGPVFDPKNLKGPPPTTPEQKKARIDYLNSQEYRDYLKSQQHQAPSGPPGGMPPQGGPPGGMFGPQGMAAPSSVDDKAVLAQYFGRPPIPGTVPPPGMVGPGGGPPPPPGMEEGNPGPQLPQANASAAVQKANQELPQGGQFDPSKQQGDISCWAFDDTVVPGHTYRYRIRYQVLNPVHNNATVAGSPEVLHSLAMISQYSDWSSAVPVQESINFFVNSGIGSGDKVNFKIYEWANGQTSAVTESDGPGDVIGAEHANANGVNYTTQWTVVAVRQDYLGENYVLLLNNSTGQMIQRSYHSDDLSPVNRKLQHEVEANQPAPGTPGAPAGAPGAGGGRPTF